VAAVQTALSTYGRDHRVGEVGMEYVPDGAAGEQPEVRTGLWSGDGSPPRHRLLGTAHDHGIPVQLVAPGS
jgi:hypothetical protein